jgi:hypothetical protein
MRLYDAIFQLNPTIVIMRDDIAYDAEGNVVEYNLTAAEAKLIEMQAESQAAKQSALNKLMALGLTEEEALALGVK